MGRTKASLGRLLVALLVASIVSTVAAAGQSPREIAKRVSPSVVLLVMEDANGQPLAMGSGFVVREGIVATNLHVIEAAARGYAKVVDQKAKHDVAGVVASDPARDLVLLAVDGLTAPLLSIGDSDLVAIGDDVFAVGNPRGLEGTFSAGIVSSIRKVGEDSLLQITAPISPGSSGGPVVNSKGEVIGVAVATFKGGQNLNFAIPSRYLSALLPLVKQAVALPEASAAAKAKKEKSLLDEMGGRSNDGIIVGQFLWDLPGNPYEGSFSCSVRNTLREPVRNIRCLLVFSDSDGLPVDTFAITFDGPLLPGLAKRICGQVDGSVKILTSGKASAPRKLEFRVLYFDVIEADDTMNEDSGKTPGRSYVPNPSAPIDEDQAADTPRREAPLSREEAQARLQEIEERLAAAVAQIAPAGGGPDLIEGRIDGEFTGWDGETIFKLDNGQIWQQVTFGFTYTCKFRPKVWIIKAHGAYKMKVDGVSGTIFVRRLR